MTPAVLLALLLTLYMLWWLGKHQSVCVQCQGRGRHRKGCPFNKEDE